MCGRERERERDAKEDAHVARRAVEIWNAGTIPTKGLFHVFNASSVSTGLPRGNQVDGLPRACKFSFDVVRTTACCFGFLFVLNLKFVNFMILESTLQERSLRLYMPPARKPG